VKLGGLAVVLGAAVAGGSFRATGRDRVRRPNGHEAERVVVRHPGAACVLAVTADKRVVLVRQWRHPTAAAPLELPARNNARKNQQTPRWRMRLRS